MTISQAQANRIRESRKRVSKKKDEYLLQPVEPTHRQQIRFKQMMNEAIDRTQEAVLTLYSSAGDIRTIDQSLDQLYENMSWWDELNIQVGQNVSSLDEVHRQAFYETITTNIGVNVAGFVQEQGLSDLIDTIIDDNVQKVTDLKVASQKRVADLIKNAFTGQESKSFSLEQQIRRTFKTTKNTAKFIARDQTQRNVNSLNRFRQERAGIKKYRWVTSKDNRVRDTHAIMQGAEVDWKTGKILKSPNKSIVGKNVKNVAGGHVGQDYQCRCSAVPILEV